MARQLGARLALMACCLGAVHCGGSGLKSPATGGDAWYEANSEHFVIQTDAGPEAASELVAEYERLVTFFETVAFRANRQPKGVTRLVVFEQEGQYEQIGPRLTTGFFSRKAGAPYDPRPTIVMTRQAGNRAVLQLFCHELTHRYVAFHFPTAPIWVHEGLAMYFEPLRIEDNKVLVGLIPSHNIYPSTAGARTESQGWVADTANGYKALRWLPSSEQIRKLSQDQFYAEETRDIEDASTEKQLNYIAAWAQIHTLMLGTQDLQERFMRYLNALANAHPNAWAENFDATSEQALEAQYRDLVTNSRMRSGELPAPPLPAAGQAPRLMQDSEVFWLWATLRNWGTAEGRQGAAKEIEQSIQLAPKWPDGYLLRSALAAKEQRPTDQRRDIELALAQDPNNGNALGIKASLLLYEQAHKPPAERNLSELDAVIKLLRPRAKTSGHWLTLSQYAGLHGRPEEALQCAKIATKDSSCWFCYWRIGELELAMKHVGKAARALRVAAAMAEEDAPPELLAELREVLNSPECQQSPSEC